MILAAALAFLLAPSGMDVNRAQDDAHAVMDYCGCYTAKAWLVAEVADGRPRLVVTTTGRVVTAEEPPFFPDGLRAGSRFCRTLRQMFHQGYLQAFPGVSPKDVALVREQGGDGR